MTNNEEDLEQVEELLEEDEGSSGVDGSTVSDSSSDGIQELADSLTSFIEIYEQKNIDEEAEIQAYQADLLERLDRLSEIVDDESVVITEIDDDVVAQIVEAIPEQQSDYNELEQWSDYGIVVLAFIVVPIIGAMKLIKPIVGMFYNVL